MTANTLRGEVVFKAGERELTLRPTFDALAKIEGIVGQSFFAYVQDLNASTARITEVAAITAAACVDDITAEEAGELIVEYGAVAFINGPFSELILRGAGYHESLDRAEGDDSGK